MQMLPVKVPGSSLKVAHDQRDMCIVIEGGGTFDGYRLKSPGLFHFTRVEKDDEDSSSVEIPLIMAKLLWAGKVKSPAHMEKNRGKKDKDDIAKLNQPISA
jgi:hypothetical protein